MLAQHDFAELSFLDHGDGLHLDHFEDGEKGDDHGVARRASLEKADEVNGVVVAGQNLRTELGIICATVNCSCCSRCAKLLCGARGLAGRRGRGRPWRRQLAFGAFVVVQRFVGLGPDVFFDLLFLVEELRGVFLNFSCSTRRCTRSARGSVDCSSGLASGSGGSSIFDLM